MKIDCFVLNFVEQHLKGNGLEIGAFFQPFKRNDKTRMTYQDRYTRSHFVELAQTDKNIVVDNIVDTDVICDAHYQAFKDETFDFVCNSHVFEHLYNPVLALENWLNQTIDKGYVYFIVPDKTVTFDAPRDITPVQHIINDYWDCKKDADLDHYLEFYGKVHPYAQIGEVLKHYSQRQDIHLHTFTVDSLIELLKRLELILPFKTLDIKVEGMHIACLLQKGETL